MTIAATQEYKVILAVGDTTYLDYRGIKEKKEGYGPTGNGGNGLILHSSLAVEPEKGQAIGLLWQKLWNRDHKPKPPQDETPEEKKQRKKNTRKAARQRAFEDKESYKWVEAINELETKVEASTRVVHIFDREGDVEDAFNYRSRRLNRNGCDYSQMVYLSLANRGVS